MPRRIWTSSAVTTVAARTGAPDRRLLGDCHSRPDDLPARDARSSGGCRSPAPRENWFGPDHRPRRRTAPRTWGPPALKRRGHVQHVACEGSSGSTDSRSLEATGRWTALESIADIDDVILGGVVAEWCERHARRRSTSARSRVRSAPDSDGTDGPSIRMDAIDFCRVLAGRAPRQPAPQCRLLETLVPF